MTATSPAPDLEVRLDLRVEAVMGALALAVPRLPGAGWLNHAIRRRACRRWGPLCEHPAPRLLRRLLGPHFWVDDLCVLAIYLHRERDGRLESRASAAGFAEVTLLRGLSSLATALADFSEQARLDGILEQSAHLPGEVVDGIGGVHNILRWSARLRQVLGPGPASIRIVPSPLCGAHLGFGPTIVKDGRSEAWVIFGPVWRPMRRPYEMVGFCSPKLAKLIRHELGHAHLNRHTANSPEVSALSYLFAGLEPAMRTYGYGRWDVCLNEMILRAVEIRLLDEEFGERAAQQATVSEERKGFSLVRAAVAALREIAGTPLSDAMPQFFSFFEHSARRTIA
jgi:Domain of unknown function (DUF4932)